MPKEVFQIWLVPLISDVGWPFTQITDYTFGTPWERFFDGFTLQKIRDFSWQRHNISRSLCVFHPTYQKTIYGIATTHIYKRQTIWTNFKNGKASESFFRSRRFIQDTGRFHTPAILAHDSQGYKIMDGNHRIAAAFSLNLTNSFHLDCWIGN